MRERRRLAGWLAAIFAPALILAGLAFAQVTVNPSVSGGASSTRYTLLSSQTLSGTTATVSFTGINAEDILIVCSACTVDVNTQIGVAVSTNNGSSYGSVRTVGWSLTTTAQYGTMSATGLRSGYVALNGFNASTTATSVNTNGANASGAAWAVGAQVNAIQLSVGANNFAAGTYSVYTR